MELGNYHVKVHRVDNGFIIQDGRPECDAVYVYEENVEKHGEFANLHAFKEMLYMLQNMIGPDSSDFDKETLKFIIVPGDEVAELTETEND